LLRQLVARHLAQLPPDELAQQCLQLAGGASPGHWQLVLTLAARIAPAHAGTQAADALVDSDDIADAVAAGTAGAGRQRLALMAARMLAEMQPVDRLPKPRQRIVQRIAGWLVHALPLHPGEGGMVAAERAEAGDLLALLGDPRFDAECWHLPADPMLGFVRIASDLGFCIGTRNEDQDKVKRATGRDANKDEINAAVTPVAGFYIARYPVTVAQFRAYLDSTGTKSGDPGLLRDPPTRPVRWVSWHEARAYCLWLQQQLLTLPETYSGEVSRLLHKGWEVRLPTELQWERAARGPARGQVFSWGDVPDAEQANQSDTGLDHTSPVGCFPVNPEGLSDMLGNLWEWTASRWAPHNGEGPAQYPECTADPRFDAWVQAAHGDVIIIRGGMFRNDHGSVRCAARLVNAAFTRVSNRGFRVVLSAASLWGG
jgi:formylglycine-generating enzyme required for sulfatase activity